MMKYKYLLLIIILYSCSEKNVENNQVNPFDLEPNNPHIDSISPDTLSTANWVYIYGKGFGNVTYYDSHVLFQNIKSYMFKNWSDSLVVCKVPAGLKSGFLTLMINNFVTNEVIYFMPLLPIDSLKYVWFFFKQYLKL